MFATLGIACVLRVGVFPPPTTPLSGAGFPLERGGVDLATFLPAFLPGVWLVLGYYRFWP